jgi:hypothetical protein
MSEHTIRPLADIDVAHAQQLVLRVREITSFDDASSWCSAADSELGNLSTVLSQIDAQAQDVAHAKTLAIAEHHAKPFLQRWFTRSALVKAADAWRQHADIVQGRVSDLAHDLTEWKASLPTSLQDQKSRLKELRLKKRELSQTNREVGASMREIRRGARQANAEVGTGLEMLFSNGKYRRIRHTEIRVKKERILRPYENERASIAEQIAVVDRSILWLERFGQS